MEVWDLGKRPPRRWGGGRERGSECLREQWGHSILKVLRGSHPWLHRGITWGVFKIPVPTMLQSIRSNSAEVGPKYLSEPPK